MTAKAVAGALHRPRLRGDCERCHLPWPCPAALASSVDLAAAHEAVEDTYTAEGVRIWWHNRHRFLGGRSPADCFVNDLDGSRARVVAVALSLTGMVAT